MKAAATIKTAGGSKAAAAMETATAANPETATSATVETAATATVKPTTATAVARLRYVRKR
jgi:hypothetical protein